jgi:hypothetical protein
LKKAFYFLKNWQRSAISNTLFSTGKAAEKERHAWTPSFWSRWHQKLDNNCFLLAEKESHV